MQGLEPFFQSLRIRKIWPDLIWQGDLVDFGCDHELTLIRRVKSNMKSVIGIDIVSQKKKFENVRILPEDLTKKLSLKSNSADTITMLAVLEHLPNPARAVGEAYRILKPGGVFLVTVPAPVSAYILPTLAKLRLVRQDMIDQHQNYFTQRRLHDLAKRAGFRQVSVESWELGCNTFMKAIK